MTAIALLGTTLGLAFTSGLNLYATVLATGVAIRMGWLSVPPAFGGLDVLAHPAVLAAAAVLYVIEFVADKVPIVEHLWDAVHTVVRPVGAVWVAWTAVSGVHLSAPAETVLLLAVGSVAASTHFGKAGSRVASAVSGGHFAGVGLVLSLFEDLVSFVVAPLAIAHPLVALAITAVLLAALGALVAKGYRYLRGTRRPSRA